MSAEAERHLRRLAEVELRQGGEARVEPAADVLVALGAIGEETADEVLGQLHTARAIREQRLWPSLHGVPYPRWRERRPSPPGHPDGELRIKPVGATMPSGRPGEILHLLTVAAAPGRGLTVTVAGRISPDRRPLRDQVPIGPFGPYSLSDLGLTFTVNDDRRYPGEIDGGGTCDGTWWCLAVLLPADAAPLTRLDVATVDGSVAISVEIEAGADAARDAGVTADALVPNAAEERAEQVLDALAASLLWARAWPSPDVRYRRQAIVMADAVQAAGLLAVSSPAIRRYTALTARLGDDDDGAGPGPADLPAAWTDVLANRRRQDGPDRAWATTAVLPVLDGVRFAVAGLVSTAESATLRLLAWGWSPSNDPAPEPRFSWWARGDTGRWHVGRLHWQSVTRQVVVMDVTLVPPLDPAATALEVIVTGRGGRVRATVDL